MMTYERPVVLESGELFEGVYTESGGEEPTITANVIWTNQNSGSHSDLSVYVSCGSVEGEYIRVTVTWHGNGNMSEPGGYSGPYTSVDFSDGSVTFVREGHFNSGENFEFGFNNVVFDSCGDPDDRDGEHFGSYYASGSHCGEYAGEFSVDYECHA